jgi:hypothetical protein
MNVFIGFCYLVRPSAAAGVLYGQYFWSCSMFEEWSSGMLRRVALVRTDVSEELSVRRLLVTVGVVPSSPILVTLMKEARKFSVTSVLTRATRRNIPEDTILHSHRRENPRSYTCSVFVQIVIRSRASEFIQQSLLFGGLSYWSFSCPRSRIVFDKPIYRWKVLSCVC